MKDIASKIVRAGLPMRRRPRRDRDDEPAADQQSRGDDGEGGGTGDRRRKRSPRRLLEMLNDAPPSRHSVYAELDSWEPRHRPSTEKELRSSPGREELEGRTATVVESPVENVPETIHPGKRMPAHKKRRAALSICVSDEEAQLLRRHAAKMGVGFSAWARGILFKAMGRKTPARPKRE